MLALHELLNRRKQKQRRRISVFAARSLLLAFSGAVSLERRLIAGQSRLGPYQLYKHTDALFEYEKRAPPSAVVSHVIDE